MITREEFKIMQDSARCLLQVVLDYKEAEFKETFISPQCSYSSDEYELNRAHVSGSVLRINIRFEDDYSETDLYFDLTEVIERYYDMAEKVTVRGE